ncbi:MULTISPECIES: formate dehydrogenase [Shewanella]|uniref:formate dehydrogenase n=1 Tax=Shewanella TaxID=22 RepID=UPI001C659186|nr:MULTISPECIES: formate dehydrogenase [Shewanella]QYJ75382.1 formate dehydrogenase [Shewanella sp. FJAT-52076]QYK05237.1 formate dehydrogenase [Shewanella zhangzhouensis]
MKTTPNSAERRAFLKTMAMGSVAGVAVATCGSAVAQPLESASAQSKGYRETEHVRRYYASLRGE